MSGLCKTNFPLYCCRCVDEKHFFVCGGGGAAKTGVRNCVQIVEITKERKKTRGTSVHQFDTGKDAVMHMSVKKSLSETSSENNCQLALAMGTKCNVYSVKSHSKPEEENNEKSSVRKRKKETPPKEKKTNTINDGIDNYIFSQINEIESPSSNEVTAVQLSSDCSVVAVGDSKGHLRSWQLMESKHKLIFDAHGHKEDITDVDISPDKEKIVTVSRDCKAYLWDSSNGHKLLELSSLWNVKMLTRAYRFRNCRFAVIPELPDKFNLFTSHCPAKQDPNNKRPNICCITKWARRRNKEGSFVSDLLPAIIQGTGKEPISSMAVSPNGVFVGVGFMEGSVAIYIAFSLQCARRVRNVHSIFVTSLSFLHDDPRTRELKNECDAALVSVSADCTCKLTKLSSRSMFPMWIVVILCIIAIVCSSLYLHSVGLI